MARESVVSREFKGTKVTFLAMNTSSCMPERVDYTFESRMTNDDDILKQLTKAYKNTDIVPAKVLEKKDFTKLLAMKTEDFMKYAFELDLETRKRLEPVSDVQEDVQETEDAEDNKDNKKNK